MIGWLAGAVLSTSGAIAHDPALLSAPVIDLPSETHGAYAAPTWDQSIELTKAQYQASHRAFAAWAERRYGRAARDPMAAGMGLAWELLAGWLPLGNAWAHEEGHRAVMDYRGIKSLDGVYDFDPTSGAIYVRSVRDRDLVWLKANHPADSVRLAAAGMETETVINVRVERDLFFLRGRIATDWATLVANKVNNIGYVWTCSDTFLADPFTDKANDDDGDVIVRRDALGLDCLAWAYDLQRPGEPYAARGVHPSGRGIDRYVKFSDLTYDEQKLLRTVRWMSLANLADPFLYFHEGVRIGDARATSALAFYLTSFGWTVDHAVLVATGPTNLTVTAHHHVNGARWMPGLDFEVWRLPMSVRNGEPWRLTLGGGVWLQPESQRWETAHVSPGGRATFGVAIPLWRSLELDLGASYKTAGWVAAVASLDAEASLRAGFSWRLGD